MASEALPFSAAVAARELAAGQREAARRQEIQAAAIQAEEEYLAEQSEAEAARTLAASQRTAGRGKESGGGQSAVAMVTETAGEIIDLITAVVEFLAIIPPLALLANYHVRFLSGNLGVLPEVGGPASKFLDAVMEVASAGAKTAGKTGSKAAGQAGGKAAAGSPPASSAKKPSGEQKPPQDSIGGALSEVKKLAIWQIFIMVVIDIYLVVNFMLLLLLPFIFPLLVAGGVAGTIVGFCLEYPNVCTTIQEGLGISFDAIVSFFTS